MDARASTLTRELRDEACGLVLEPSVFALRRAFPFDCDQQVRGLVNYHQQWTPSGPQRLMQLLPVVGAELLDARLPAVPDSIDLPKDVDLLVDVREDRDADVIQPAVFTGLLWVDHD